MKKGYKTTEFWLTAIASVAGILVSTGILTPDESTNWQELLGGLVLAVAPIWQYIKGRTAVKVASVSG